MRAVLPRILANAATAEVIQNLQEYCMSLAVRPAEPAAPLFSSPSVASRRVRESLWAPRFAIALWVVLGFALTARTLYRPESHTVFPVFAAGSIRWWTDQPLYANYRPMDYFRYPPFFAVVIT